MNNALSERPDAQTLFALYHLGVDGQGAYAFRNLMQCARHLGVDAETFRKWLKDNQIDQDVITRVAFNLSAAHVDAQLAADNDSRLALAKASYAAFVAARAEGLGDVNLDVDYDEL